MKAQDLWSSLTDRHWKTWIGHLILGGGMFLVLKAAFGQAAAWAFVVGWFGSREESNVESKLPKLRALPKQSATKRRAKAEMVVDGFFDFFAPIIACAILDSLT